MIFFRRSRLAILLAAAGLTLFAAGLSAETVDPDLAKILGSDAPQARDHALTGRYRDAVVLGQSAKAFDEVALPSAPAVGQTYDSAKRFEATATVQGRVSRTLYVAPSGRSSLEVHANVRDEVAGKGFAPVFECARDACGPSFAVLKYNWNNPATHVLAPGYPNRRVDLIRASFDAVGDVRYSLLKRSENGADAYVAIFTANNTGGTFGDLSAALRDRVESLVEVVEPRAMERRIEMLAANDVGAKLAAEGRVALYAIQFDFDKATLRPESDPQLAEMAKLMQAKLGLRVFVVGHTDNKGGLDYNLDLSRRRAEAVVQALVQRHRIPPTRLMARGLGPLAPLASNAGEDGQARNRRVELVEM
jgi:OmpA-OmpF porin, OOP family